MVSRELGMLSWQDQPSSSRVFMGLLVGMAPARGPIWPCLPGVADEACGAESFSGRKEVTEEDQWMHWRKHLGRDRIGGRGCSEPTKTIRRQAGVPGPGRPRVRGF